MDGNKFVASRVGECIEGPVMLQDLESTVISVYDVVGRVKAKLAPRTEKTTSWMRRSGLKVQVPPE